MMLSTLNLQVAVCQLYLNKTRGKRHNTPALPLPVWVTQPVWGPVTQLRASSTSRSRIWYSSNPLPLTYYILKWQGHRKQHRFNPIPIYWAATVGDPWDPQSMRSTWDPWIHNPWDHCLSWSRESDGYCGDIALASIYVTNMAGLYFINKPPGTKCWLLETFNC